MPTDELNDDRQNTNTTNTNDIGGTLKEGQMRVKVNGERRVIDVKDFDPNQHTPLNQEDRDIANKEIASRKAA